MKLELTLSNYLHVVMGKCNSANRHANMDHLELLDDKCPLFYLLIGSIIMYYGKGFSHIKNGDLALSGPKNNNLSF